MIQILTESRFLYRRKPLTGRAVQKKSDGDNVDRKTPFVYNKDAVRQLYQKGQREGIRKVAVSRFMGYLKGKSSLMIYEKNRAAVQVLQSGILVQRLLCGHGRKE